MCPNSLASTINTIAPKDATLHAKEHAANAVLEVVLECHAPTAVAVAWTGGKDSTLVMHLWRSVLRERGVSAAPRAISIDTGCKFPEVMSFRDDVAARWGIDVAVIRPDVDFHSYPVAQDKLACCRDLKVRPLLDGIRKLGIDVLLTGVRADEHASRSDRGMAEVYTDPDHLRVHPVLCFTEMDVWAYAMDRGVPMCSLYQQGYRSLGCVPCTALAAPDAAERQGRDSEKEAQLGQLRSLGYF